MSTPVKPDYPKLTLDNGVISVGVYLPDAARGYYRGTRFDWSGIIERVDCGDHRFYAPLHSTHDPVGHDYVSGPAEEFAMTNPSGFAQATAGDPFVKIGVGVLRKGEDLQYRFDGPYDLLRAGDWDIEQAPSRVAFMQDLQAGDGWAYRYRKTLSLVPGRAELRIDHSLENTGMNTIDIDHYNHNFTLIDDTPYGPDYRVEFPFATGKPVPITDLGWFRENAIEVDRPLGDESIWIPVYEGGAPVANSARICNQRTGAADEFEGDAPLARMVFWAVERAACPEPFIRIHLAPGQAMDWCYHYRYLGA